MKFLVSNPRPMQPAIDVEARSLLRHAALLLATASKVSANVWHSLLQTIATPTKMKSLIITDKVALAEKSTLAIANIEGKRFLIGAAANGITLLTELDPLVSANCATQSRKSTSVGTTRRKKPSPTEESLT